MGKYMRKAKLTGEVAVMDISHQSSLGVRTRARTLALQRLQKPLPPSLPLDQGFGDASYLQLRNRRLEKPPVVSSPRARTKEATCAKKNPSGGLEVCSANSASVGSASVKGVEQLMESDGGLEISFGENIVELDSRDRNARETTPCSLILNSEAIGTPGSTTRPTNSSVINRRKVSTECRNIPTTNEMEEFFAGAEQLQRRIFTEKYNYDLVNDCPLPGRYEWVRLNLSW